MGMELKARYENGIFRPLEEVKGIKTGTVVEILVEKKGLRRSKFFGMWSDRKDIRSSTEYVRKLREWKR